MWDGGSRKSTDSFIPRLMDHRSADRDTAHTRKCLNRKTMAQSARQFGF